MAILIVCPGCKKSFNVDDKFAGKTGPCPKCKTKITIPEKTPEVKIHAPDEFAGGGKSVTGKLLLKPIAREQSRIKPLGAALIGGAVLAAIGWALAIRYFTTEATTLHNLLSQGGLLLVSPLIVIAAYSFLRDDELAPYRGTQLYIRAGVCGLVYAILWASFFYVKSLLGSPIDDVTLFLIVLPFVGIGGATGKFSLDLETTNGFFHYAFYLAVTMILAAIAGLPMAWQ